MVKYPKYKGFYLDISTTIQFKFIKLHKLILLVE